MELFEKRVKKIMKTYKSITVSLKYQQTDFKKKNKH